MLKFIRKHSENPFILEPECERYGAELTYEANIKLKRASLEMLNYLINSAVDLEEAIIVLEKDNADRNRDIIEIFKTRLEKIIDLIKFAGVEAINE